MKYVMRIKDRIPVRKVTAMTEAMRDNGVWCSGRASPLHLSVAQSVQRLHLYQERTG